MRMIISWPFAGAPRAPATARDVACAGRVAVVLLGLLLFARPALAADETTVSKEYQLKAAFLYNFTKFVEWPPQHFRDARQPITIGVLGHDPFGGELEKVVEGRTINGRAIVVKGLTTASEALGVELVFVGEQEEARFAESLAARDGVHVVTVGESPRSAALGAVITFTMEADKVRFEINQGGAEKAGLKISAQLLKLATVVRKRAPGG